jgi:biopolymer transport protein TolQ
MILASTFFKAYFQSDLFGKSIFLMLFALSSLSWIILIEKLFLVRKLKKLCKNFALHVKKSKLDFFQIPLPKDIEQYAKSNMHPFFEIFLLTKEKTLEILEKNSFFQKKPDKEGGYLSQADMGLIDSHLSAKIVGIMQQLEKNLFLLSTVVTLAPFMGLLGTVWGILLTFTGLQTSSLVSGNTAVLSGLSMALATTVVGLVVAIPALVGYNYLRNTLKEFTQEMEIFSHYLLATVEIQYRKVDEG